MRFRSMLLAVVMACAAVIGVAGTAQAADPVPAGCTGARQLGGTAYATDIAGNRIASVKQYFGTCGGTGKNWAYVYVWESFFNSGKAYQVKAGILTRSGDSLGFRSAPRPAREIFSTPVATAGVCTRGWGGLDLATTSRTATTAEEC